MTFLSADELNIQASGFGPVMTARESIARAKEVLLDLEKISPWRRPFYVSGCTEETGRLQINEDLSNFDEQVMAALQSYDERRYLNEREPDNPKLMPSSTSFLGFPETFYRCEKEDDYGDAISISLQSSGIGDDRLPLDDSFYMLEIRAFKRGQANDYWSDPALIYCLFDYFIDTYNPMRCRVFSSYQMMRTKLKESSYNIGWLNYTRDPKVAAVFVRTGKTIPYRNGVLLSFGDDVSVLSDPKVDQELIEIRKMLRAAGVMS